MAHVGASLTTGYRPSHDGWGGLWAQVAGRRAQVVGRDSGWVSYRCAGATGGTWHVGCPAATTCAAGGSMAGACVADPLCAEASIVWSECGGGGRCVPDGGTSEAGATGVWVSSSQRCTHPSAEACDPANFALAYPTCTDGNSDGTSQLISARLRTCAPDYLAMSDADKVLALVGQLCAGEAAAGCAVETNACCPGLLTRGRGAPGSLGPAML
jgi:hypothetical protein